MILEFDESLIKVTLENFEYIEYNKFEKRGKRYYVKSSIYLSGARLVHKYYLGDVEYTEKPVFFGLWKRKVPIEKTLDDFKDSALYKKYEEMTHEVNAKLLAGLRP